jgi:hypothetical protein
MPPQRHVHCRSSCGHTTVEFFEEPRNDGERKLLVACADCGFVISVGITLGTWPTGRDALPPWWPWEPAGLLRQVLINFPPNE